MRILGIDPGLQRSGWAAIECDDDIYKLIDSGVTETKAKDEMHTRLKCIHEALSIVIKTHKPDISSIEKTFVNKNPQSSLSLGHARGAMLLTLSMHNLEIHEYDATAIKKTVTGNGRASKEQIARMIHYLIPSINEYMKYHDEYDAIAIAICHRIQCTSKKYLQ